MRIADSVSTPPSMMPQARMTTPPPPPLQNNGGGSIPYMQNHQNHQNHQNYQNHQNHESHENQASIPVYTRDKSGISTGCSAIGTGRFTHIYLIMGIGAININI